VATCVVVLLFLAALQLWSGGLFPDSGKNATAIPGPTTSSPAVAPGATPSAGSTTGRTEPSAAGSTAPATVGGVRIGTTTMPLFPLSTDINTLPPGTEAVTFRATGDAPIGAVGYQVQGQAPHGLYSVASPMTVVVRAPAGYRAIMAVQVSAFRHTATCSIAINGQVKVTETAHGPNHVVTCVV
jgi:hypothetical protein